jgi:hypothetical protein
MKTRSLRQIRQRTLRPNSSIDDVDLVNPRISAIRTNQPGQHFHRRAFARSVRTDEQRDFAGCRAEGDAAQDEIASVTFGDLFSRNHRSLGKSAIFCVARAARWARTFQKCELSGAGSSM